MYASVTPAAADRTQALQQLYELQMHDQVLQVCRYASIECVP